MANDETKTALDGHLRAGADRRSSGRSDARLKYRYLAASDASARDAGILLEIADCPKPKDIPPALPAMFGRIVDHVAALT